MSDATSSDPRLGAEAPNGSDAPAEAAQALLAKRADPRTNTIVKRVLRSGLALALVLLVVGLVVQLASGHDGANQVRMLDIASAHPIGEELMGFGVLALALTPTCGVLSVLLSWVRERDRVYVGVGILIVIVLSTAVVVGLAGA